MSPDQIETVKALAVLVALAVAGGKPLPLLGSLLGAVAWLVFRRPLAIVHGLGAVSVVWFVAAHPVLTAAAVVAFVGVAVLAVAARRANTQLAPAVAW